MNRNVSPTIHPQILYQIHIELKDHNIERKKNPKEIRFRNRKIVEPDICAGFVEVHRTFQKVAWNQQVSIRNKWDSYWYHKTKIQLDADKSYCQAIDCQPLCFNTLNKPR